MTLGFDKQLYILPFDQRGTFQSTMFGWAGSLLQSANVLVAGSAVFGGGEAVPAAMTRLRAAVR